MSGKVTTAAVGSEGPAEPSHGQPVAAGSTEGDERSNLRASWPTIPADASWGILRAPMTRADRDGLPRCGARTRAGGTCQAPPVWDAAMQRVVNGRCRRHGGHGVGVRRPKREGG